MRSIIPWLFCCLCRLLCHPSFAYTRLPPTTAAWRLFANPVTSEGSSYRSDISEEEAFLWFDEAVIFVRAGSGGHGSSAVKFGKARQHVAPAGGSGGNGGAVILRADSSMNTLLGFRGSSSFRAENGQDGGIEYANGLAGDDCVVNVPVGTVILNNSTDEVIGDLSFEGQLLTVAAGGIGGKGNAASRTKGEKSVCVPPTGGQRLWIRLELKLVADVGLVGVPNAGKSSLLDAITNARPKIASYPFTTIIPNLGVCSVDAFIGDGVTDGMVVADIPGLIEGASQGVGLGRRFLRHVERCSIILHIVDGNSVDPIKDFVTINEELLLFSSSLAAKPQIVVLNKIDIPEVNEKLDQILNGLLEVMPHTRLLAVSAAGRLNLKDLVSRTYNFLRKVKGSQSSNT